MRNPSIVFFIILMLTAFGIYSLPKMNKDEFPQFTIRQGVVAAIYPGATAQEVEEQATLLTLTDYHVLLNQWQSTCDFYSNTIPIFNTSLLSPLAPSGNTYYNYYLADSTHVHGEKHYIVHFVTVVALHLTKLNLAIK